MSRGFGRNQSKLMILLLGTTSMALTPSPFKQYEIIKEMQKEWKGFNKEKLRKSLDSLCKSELLLRKMDSDGHILLSLTERGLDSAAECLLSGVVLRKEKKWDKKWRMVIFDIPEEYRSARDALRYRLNKIGFIELQRSVFVYPFDCFDIISKIINLYQISNFVNFVTAESIKKEDKLKAKFNSIISR